MSFLSKQYNAKKVWDFCRTPQNCIKQRYVPVDTVADSTGLTETSANTT